MVNKTSEPFSFLHSTLNLLIIEDDPLSKSFVTDLIEIEKVFSIYTASSASEALTILRSGKRIHLCIMDLGINDIQNDEFFILRQYSNLISFIVLTGSNSPVKGATCIQLGARAVFEKGPSINCKTLLDSIHYNTLINLVNPKYSENSHDTINSATRILFEKRPESVTAWAEFLSITDRQLRNLWHTEAGIGVKYILFLYTLYHSAFTYYCKTVFEDTFEASNYLNLISEPKLATYFTINSKTLQQVLF